MTRHVATLERKGNVAFGRAKGYKVEKVPNAQTKASRKRGVSCWRAFSSAFLDTWTHGFSFQFALSSLRLSYALHGFCACQQLNPRVKFIRDVVREVVGFAPYERRCIELLKVSKDKRALKFCKKRLGTHIRGKRKREEMSNVIVAQRKATTKAKDSGKE